MERRGGFTICPNGGQYLKNDPLPSNSSLLKLAIDVPYDRRFIRLVQDWIFQVIALANGNQSDAAALGLALEETLVSISEAFPDDDSNELIHIQFRLMEHGQSEITLENAGPPMHPDQIPEYNPKAPLTSDTAGLWYFLARAFADDIEFKNMGMDGWRVIIRKRLARWSFQRKRKTEKSMHTRPVHSGDLVTRPASPSDAAGLMDLTYDTYRYTYPAPEFYEKPALRQALETGKLNSIVVTHGTTIAGNLSFTVHPDRPNCAHLCSLMVKRRFRNSPVGRCLQDAQNRLLDDNQAGVDLYSVAMVTAHTFSQKVGAKSGLFPLALLLSVGAPVSYTGMSVTVKKRESFVFCIRLARPMELDTIYLPPHHHEVMRPLLAQAGCGAGLSGETKTPETPASVFREELNRTERHAYLTIRQIGVNWTTEIRKRLFRLRGRGIDCIIVLIPAWRALPPDIDLEMARHNGVFCGILPTSARRFFLAYCTLAHGVDFEEINLADPLADNLKRHIRDLYTDMIEG